MAAPKNARNWPERRSRWSPRSKCCRAVAARRSCTTIFGPLGYEIEAVRYPLDEKFAEWGPSPYYSVTLSKTTTLSELLTHLYVLIPVFDNFKHYYVGQEELEKLLKHGEGWLASHPKAGSNHPSLPEASAQPCPAGPWHGLPNRTTSPPRNWPRPAPKVGRRSLEKPISLNEQRLGEVVAALKASGAKRVLDLGCGEGKLLRELLKEKQFEEIVGMDVAVRALEIAKDRLRLDDLPPRQKDRIRLLHGSLMYRDKRLAGFEAAAVVEVVEHLDPPRLAAFERVVFEFARPGTVVLTTPNREYNVDVADPRCRGLSPRGSPVRVELGRSSRPGRRAWRDGSATRSSSRRSGRNTPNLGSPTQMGVFRHEMTTDRYWLPKIVRDDPRTIEELVSAALYSTPMRIFLLGCGLLTLHRRGTAGSLESSRELCQSVVTMRNGVWEPTSLRQLGSPERNFPKAVFGNPPRHAEARRMLDVLEAILDRSWPSRSSPRQLSPHHSFVPP